MRKRDAFGAVLAAGLLVAACSSDGTESTSDDQSAVQDRTPEQDDEATEVDGVFSFAEDDLCEWISEDTLTGFVAGEFDWDGVAVEVAAPPEQADDEPRGRVACQWELTEPSAGYVTIFAPTALEVGGGLANYDDVAGFIVDQPVLGHPALSEGVAYIQEGWSRPAFGVPAANAYFILGDSAPGLYPSEDRAAQEDYWESWYVIADEIIAELGWMQYSGRDSG